MPIVNSFSKAIVREFSLEELEQAARLMRGYDLVALCAAGSGHSGGTLSMMEIVAALYSKGRRSTIPTIRSGRNATASSGQPDIRPPLCISASPSPDTFPSKTSSPCASSIRHSRAIHTG